MSRILYLLISNCKSPSKERTFSLPNVFDHETSFFYKASYETTRVLTLLVAVHILFGWRSHCLLCESDWFVHFSAYVYICVILRLREKGKTSKTHQYWRDQKINVHEFGSSKYNVLQKKILQVFWTRFPSSNTKVLENWRSEVWNGFRRVKIKVSQGCVSMFLLEALEENHFLAFSSL